jgi:hypothetical protein
MRYWGFPAEFGARLRVRIAAIGCARATRRPCATTVFVRGSGRGDIGQGAPLGSPNPVISIPGQTGVPAVGCNPPNDPNCHPSGSSAPASAPLAGPELFPSVPHSNVLIPSGDAGRGSRESPIENL